MVSYFHALGHEVTATDHVKPRFDEPKVKWLCIDLRKPFDFSDYDVVIQCAATTSGSKDIVNNPAIHVADNAIMNALIFRTAVEAKVKHVIFFSCSTMFTNGAITEESTIDIHDKYFGVAHTKLYNENMCDFYSRIGETKFTAIRHTNIYGPWDKYDLERSHFFGATITKVMQAIDSITVWGKGEEKRDFLHVDDLCRFVELAIEKQDEKFKLYNCGSGVGISIDDVVQKIIKASGKRIAVQHDLSAPNIPTSLFMLCDKARNELGWTPQVKLEDGIRETLEWWMKNKNQKNYAKKEEYFTLKGKSAKYAIDLFEAYTDYKDFSTFDKQQAIGFRKRLFETKIEVSVAYVHYVVQALILVRDFLLWCGAKESDVAHFNLEQGKELPKETKKKDYRDALMNIAVKMKDAV